jgi:hypothetical protein
MHLLQHQKNETQILIRGLKSYRAELKQNISNIQMTLSSHLNEIDTDHAKASSAEQSPIATYDQRQSESDQSPNSGQYPKYHTVIRRSEESVAAASRSSINSVDHLQPEINSENIYFDVAWNGATEYFSNIALQLLSHTADLNQKRDRNLTDEDGTRYRAITSRNGSIAIL